MPTPRPFPVIAGCYYVIIEAVADAKPVTNVFTFLVTTPPAIGLEATYALAVANEVAANWPNLAVNLLHETYIGQDVKVYALGDPLLPATVVPLVAPGGGVDAQHFLQIAGRIHHTVARRGKGSQSNTYLSPLGDSAVTVNGDQVTDAWRALADSHFTTFKDAVLGGLELTPGGTWHYVQLSKGTTHIPAGGTFQITSSVTERLVSSQKRRLGR